MENRSVVLPFYHFSVLEIYRYWIKLLSIANRNGHQAILPEARMPQRCYLVALNLWRLATYKRFDS